MKYTFFFTIVCHGVIIKFAKNANIICFRHHWMRREHVRMKNLSVKLKMTIIGIMVVVFMLFSVNFSVSSMRAIDERILQEEAAGRTGHLAAQNLPGRD